MNRETELVLHVAEVTTVRKRSGRLKPGAWTMIASEPDALLSTLRRQVRAEIEALGGWTAVLAASSHRAQAAWAAAQVALARPRDLGDVIDDIEHVRHGAAQRAVGQVPPVEPFFDSRDPGAVERAAAAIEQWSDPGAGRWSRRLRRYAAELRVGGLATPDEAKLVARCVSGEHDIVTLRSLLDLTMMETMTLFIGYRATPKHGIH